MAKILVIDDITDMTEIIQYFLEEEGHDVATANSSQDARKQIEKDDYEVLIIDLLMPDENGFDLMQDMAKPSTEKQPPKIIAITGGVVGIDADTMMNAASLTADTVIKKPFTKDAITKAVDDLLAA